MRLINKYYLLAFLAITISIVSCKKDSDEYIPPPKETKGEYNSLSEFYSSAAAKAQVFTFNQADGGNFTTPQGTKVTVTPNSFVDEQGNPVSGDIKLTFKDVYTKSEMIFSGMPTQTADGLLESAGEFFIKAESGNKDLALKSGWSIKVELPAITGDPDPDMRGFVIDPNSSDDNPVWIEDRNADSAILGQTGTYIYNAFGLEAGGSWYNCDKRLDFPGQETTITVTTDVSPKEFMTMVFIVFKEINTMLQLGPNDMEFLYTRAPLGEDCYLVALRLQNGFIYGDIKPITITEALKVNMTLTKTTEDDLKNRIEALN